jgi:MFS family permease
MHHLRRLGPGLPRAVWLVEAGSLTSSIGNGLVIPFAVIYLHNVRGFSLAIAGLVVAMLNGLAIVTGPSAGAVIDRVGPRPALVSSITLLAAGFCGLAFVERPWQAFAAAAVAGAGNGGFSPSHYGFVSSIASRDRLHSAYALRRMADNAGLGVGAAVGGSIAALGSAAAYQALFLADAASFVVFIGIVATIRAQPPPLVRRTPAASYARAVRDRALVGQLILNVVLMTAGAGLLETGVFFAFVRNDVGLSARTVGLLFFAGTAAILLTQLPIARALEGRRRMLGIAGVGVLWTAAWFCALAGDVVISAAAATAVLTVAVILFAAGEAVHAPIHRGVVADLAPRGLEGRYTALVTTSARVGLTLGPALGGVTLAWSAKALWPAAAGACLAGGALALVLERSLPANAQRTPVPAAPRELSATT